jgi:pantoate--beta-alanine ligase
LLESIMHELTSPQEMRAWSRVERARGRRLGFVPTMGALHEGHLRLVDRAKARTDRLVMSIFVNPLQFGPKEDFPHYPRDLARDRALASERGVDCLFVPELEAVYPQAPLVRITPGPMADTLEGAARPGHFAGVLTVVAKLFHIVDPDIAVFGRKDFQQAMLVRRMAADLDFGIEIDVAPTVRELDGLALSSRNAYLNGDERRAALALSRALRGVEQAWRVGESDPKALRRRGADVLQAPGVTLGYLELVDQELRPIARADARTVVVLAAQVGSTRLLDNVVLGEGMAADIAVRVA